MSSLFDHGLSTTVRLSATAAPSRAGLAVLAVCRDLKQRSRGGAKQNPVDDALILQRDRAQLGGKRKYDMKIWHRKQICRLRLKPFGPGGRLALRTVPVPARVVRNLLVAALIALPLVPSQFGGPTDRQSAQHASLIHGHRSAVGLRENRAVFADDVSHFDSATGGPSHGVAAVGSGRSSKSSGLGVDSILAWETWV